MQEFKRPLGVSIGTQWSWEACTAVNLYTNNLYRWLVVSEGRACVNHSSLGHYNNLCNYYRKFFQKAWHTHWTHALVFSVVASSHSLSHWFRWPHVIPRKAPPSPNLRKHLINCICAFLKWHLRIPGNILLLFISILSPLIWPYGANKGKPQTRL